MECGSQGATRVSPVVRSSVCVSVRTWDKQAGSMLSHFLGGGGHFDKSWEFTGSHSLCENIEF